MGFLFPFVLCLNMTFHSEALVLGWVHVYYHNINNKSTMKPLTI